MNVLGIETSCDETSVALITDKEIKSNLISSQDFHVEFGGVVPELSSRAHLQILPDLIKRGLREARLNLNDIDLICATAGPGLIGALLVGLTFGKALAYSIQKPFVPVNHIEGHIFSGFLMDPRPEFPYLCLVVSGGHTLLLIVKSDGEIYKLGSTIDDAAGEAFDKVAKMLGLAYPGGPSIQIAAETGKGDAIKFPVAQCKNEFDFSFSGLKTAVLRYIQDNHEEPGDIDPSDIPDIAASFQSAAVAALIEKVERALKRYKINSISLVGGVAANKTLRSKFNELASSYGKSLVIPHLSFCGDNGAMIAYRGLRLHESGRKYSLDFNAFASLPKDTFVQDELY